MAKILPGGDLGNHYDLEHLPIYVLQLEYEQDHLFAFIHEIDVPALGSQFGTEAQKFSRGCGERFRKVSLAPSHSEDNTETKTEIQDLGSQTYRERLTAFMNDFILDWPQTDGINSLEDIRAIVIAGEVSAALAAELGEIEQKAIGTVIPQVLTDEDPSAVIVRGAAMRAHYFASASRDAGCSHDSLTDEQYEQKMKRFERTVYAQWAAYQEGPEPESPEEWAKRKPRLITAAGRRVKPLKD
jgi:hypothetical protein